MFYCRCVVNVRHMATLALNKKIAQDKSDFLFKKDPRVEGRHAIFYRRCPSHFIHHTYSKRYYTRAKNGVKQNKTKTKS